MFILHMTLDDHEPKYKLNDSKIGSNPGLGFRPSPPSEAVLSSVIWFNQSRSETIEYWVSKLNDFLEPYRDSTLETCSRNKSASRSRACYFPIPSGNHSCTPEDHFGYYEGKPCVLLKLNNIFDWIPIPYLEPPSVLRDLLKFSFEQNRVYISCEGASPSDRDNIGEVEYFPHQGIPTFYYPFTNQKRYMSPFLFVQFNSITRGVLVKIECRAWAQNIAYDKDFKTGGVHFELLVD
ncbi:hypothetical protein TNIN_499171 [Trichonephila inaurata madagascariensis]|uniref:Sodium/potassium-transporting ATPase subunit beta-2 n=1 Tax=Trichonephila inaurata madagascariensis TaxID=2747483 RepID=A0A8X6WPU5_9ARAC|nr:hypothetical protein TNIN_499171 [Trichonephila inaurata madagascariensis]